MKEVKSKITQHTTMQGFISLKIYLDRARMYVGYINFFMLVIVLVNSVDTTTPFGQFIHAYKYALVPLLMLFFAVLLLVVGYFDTKFGLRSEEMRNNAAHNPVLMDMLDSLDRIEKEVCKETRD